MPIEKDEQLIWEQYQSEENEDFEFIPEPDLNLDSEEDFEYSLIEVNKSLNEKLEDIKDKVASEIKRDEDGMNHYEMQGVVDITYINGENLSIEQYIELVKTVKNKLDLEKMELKVDDQYIEQGIEEQYIPFIGYIEYDWRDIKKMSIKRPDIDEF